MFQLHVGDTPCQLTPKDYRLLADKTDGCVVIFLDKLTLIAGPLRYSGSDISVVVRDALMQPVRKVLSATHFKQVPSLDDADVQKWTPCSPGDPDAVEKSWSDIESDDLLEPPLKVADFLKSLDNVRPTVTSEDIRKHDQWTMESGA